MCQTTLISFRDRMMGHVAQKQAIEAIYLSLTQAFNSIIHVIPSIRLGKYIKTSVSQAASRGEFHEDFKMQESIFL